jgi:hypothetical protein
MELTGSVIEKGFRIIPNGLSSDDRCNADKFPKTSEKWDCDLIYVRSKKSALS